MTTLHVVHHHDSGTATWCFTGGKHCFFDFHASVLQNEHRFVPSELYCMHRTQSHSMTNGGQLSK